MSTHQASMVAQLVKNLPAMQETWVRSPGWEDPLEEGMATLFSILAWRIPMDRGAWRTTVHGVTKNWTQLKQLSLTRLSDERQGGLACCDSWGHKESLSRVQLCATL